jgi:hypothetical protein
MFQRVIIKLTGPICQCQKQNLEWSVPNSSLKLKCKTCSTELFVPNSQFGAGFLFDTPYPGDVQPKQDPDIDSEGLKFYNVEEKEEKK